MAHHFVSAEWLLSNDHWIKLEDICFPSPLRALLCGEGLLTIALSKLYQKPVTVECLRQSEWIDDQGAVGLRRDVVLKADEIPCVAASTLMPAGVLQKNPWLASMGDNPLGSVLASHGDPHRGPYEFKPLDAGLIHQPETNPSRQTWARRYRYLLEEGDLLVTEIFSPEVFDRLSSV